MDWLSKNGRSGTTDRFCWLGLWFHRRIGQAADWLCLTDLTRARTDHLAIYIELCDLQDRIDLGTCTWAWKEMAVDLVRKKA